MQIDEPERPVTALLAIPIGILLLGIAYSYAYCSSAPDIAGHAVGIDDAYISYRYSQNWVAGHGLVFNPGERVEGYTNLLYVLLMAIPFALGIDVYPFSVLVNAACVVGAQLLLFFHLRARVGRTAALVGAGVFALYPTLWNWVAAGLETPLVLLLQVGIWVLLESEELLVRTRRLIGLCACVALLILTRADGFITAGIAGGFLLLKGRFRAAIVMGVTAACTVGSIFAWRLAYYGDFLPNTYYAKVAAGMLPRVKSALRQLGGIGSRLGIAAYLVVVLFSALRLAGIARRDARAALRDLDFGTFFAVPWIAYWLYVGGDNFEDRMLLILVPIGISILLRVILADTTQLASAFSVVLLAIVPLSAVVRDDRFGKSFGPKYDMWVTLGRFLGEKKPGALLAASAVGKIPYFSGLRTIDTIGLVDAHIAHTKVEKFTTGHSKSDPDYVLSRRPDLIAGNFVSDELDMDSGMSVEKYRKAGFRVRWLLNAGQTSRGDRNIIDVGSMEKKEAEALVHRGWSFGVLERSLERPSP